MTDTKPISEYCIHTGVTLPADLFVKMKQFREQRKIPISRQIREGVSMWLEAHKEELP